jgi:hypothetical protein
MTSTLADHQLHQPVEQVFGAMAFSEEPTSFEVNGRRVFYLVRPTEETKLLADDWNQVKANRRTHLIDLKFSHVIEPHESLELADLNAEFSHYCNRQAPLPIGHALELLVKLEAASAKKA